MKRAAPSQAKRSRISTTDQMMTWAMGYTMYMYMFFRQNKSFIRFRLAFVFGLQTYYLIDFSKIYRLKGTSGAQKQRLNEIL